MPKEESILKYNHGVKSVKIPFIIYADMEFLLEKIDTRHNNPENSSTAKTNKHTAFGYLLLKYCLFDAAKNKHYYKYRDCMKSFYKDLKKHATKIISHEKKEVIPLIIAEHKIYCEKKECHICKIEFSTDNNGKKIL